MRNVFWATISSISTMHAGKPNYGLGSSNHNLQCAVVCSKHEQIKVFISRILFVHFEKLRPEISSYFRRASIWIFTQSLTHLLTHLLCTRTRIRIFLEIRIRINFIRIRNPGYFVNFFPVFLFSFWNICLKYNSHFQIYYISNSHYLIVNTVYHILAA